jgi:hypothetical protein
MGGSREVLCDLVARYGRRLLEEPRRLENLLRDLCGEERREIFVLVSALRAGVPAQLQAAQDAWLLLTVERLSRHLFDEFGLRQEVARWAVESWAVALGGNVAQRDEVVVCARGEGHYLSIGHALRHVPPGARIVVRPGTYREELVIDKPVEIVGDTGSQAQSGEAVVLEAVASSCLRMATEYAVVRRLVLRGRAGLGTRSVFAVDIPRGQLILEDCDISSRSLACIAVHGERAAPIVRRCRIHEAQGSGIFVHDGGGGTVEECEIYGNALAGIEVGKAGHPVVRRCRIYRGSQAGVYVSLGGAGVVEECEIAENNGAGVEIGWQGHPVLRRCRVSRNGTYGIKIYAGGSGDVEDCDLADNALGAWNVEE